MSVSGETIMDFKLLLIATLGDWWGDTGYHIRAAAVILFPPLAKTTGMWSGCPTRPRPCPSPPGWRTPTLAKDVTSTRALEGTKGNAQEGEEEVEEDEDGEE